MAPPPAPPANPPVVVKIAIQDEWMGLSPAAPFRAAWVIDAVPGGYHLHGEATASDIDAYMRDHEDRRKVTARADAHVPPASVDALVGAMRAPAANHFDVAAMGVNDSAAQALLDEQATSLKAETKDPALLARITDWREGLSGPVAIGRVLAGGVKRAFHTDDYPSYAITVTMSDGTTLVANASSQNAMMLPWRDAQRAEHFENALPRALHALLPAGSPNTQRLTGGIPADELERLLDQGTAPEWGRFDAEARAPAVVAALGARFQVREITLARDAGTVTVALGLPTLPSNVSLHFLTALDHGVVPQAAIDEAGQMLSLAGSSPVLARMFRDAPNDDFSLSLRHLNDPRVLEQGMGLTRAGRELFLTQMHDARQLTDIDDADAPVLMNAVVVQQGFNPTTWVVLADRRTIRWQEFTLGNGAGSPLCRVLSSLPKGDSLAWAEDAIHARCYREVFDVEGRAVPPSPHPYVPRLVRLDIDEDWIGLSPEAPRKAHWEVKPDAAGYRLRGKATVTIDDKLVANVDTALPPAQVSALVGALWAPAATTADPAALRIDEAAGQAVLDKQAEDLARRATTDDFRARIQAWRAGLRTPKGYLDAVTRGIGGFLALDDYPQVTIKATFADGSEVGFHSASSDTWMLPWRNDAGVDSYDPALPHTLAGLLPEASPNRARLLLPVRPDANGSRVRTGTHHAFIALDAEAGAPAAVAQLRKDYTVDNLWLDTNRPEAYLSATLGRPALSPKLRMRITIPLKGGVPYDADLATIAQRWKVLGTAKNLLGITRYQGTDTFTTTYTPDPAFNAREASDRALFMAQMHAAGRMKHIHAGSPALAQAFLVREKETPSAVSQPIGMGPPDTPGQAWMILGDGRSIIWQRYEEPDVLAIKSCKPRASADDDPVPARAWCVLEDFARRP